MASSVQLNVNAAATQVERIGSSFAISGSNVDTTDGTTTSTVSAGTITAGVYAPGTIAATQDTAGSAFSFTQSYTQADAVPTSAPSVGAVQNFGNITSTVSAGTITAGVYAPGTIAATQDTAGSAFSFAQSYTQGDAVPTSAPSVGAVQNFGNITSTAAGSAGSLAGNVTSAHTFAGLTAGGAGTSATGQFVTEVSIR